MSSDSALFQKNIASFKKWAENELGGWFQYCLTLLCLYTWLPLLKNCSSVTWFRHENMELQQYFEILIAGQVLNYDLNYTKGINNFLNLWSVNQWTNQEFEHRKHGLSGAGTKTKRREYPLYLFANFLSLCIRVRLWQYMFRLIWGQTNLIMIYSHRLPKSIRMLINDFNVVSNCAISISKLKYINKCTN